MSPRSSIAVLSLSMCLAACASGTDAPPDAHVVDVDSSDAPLDAGPGCPDPGTTAPLDVFCTGLYQGRDFTKYARTALPYTPGVLFWSDGAEKQRYLSLPAGTQIDTSNMDAWKF